MIDGVTIIIVIFTVGLGIFFYGKSWRLKIKLKKQKQEMGRKMYELAILKELGERIGYSLNIQEIIDVIAGSLSQFIEYKAVSYMLLKGEKIIFKIHLEESVSKKFVQEIKNKMLKSLSALLDREFKKSQLKEIVTGAILVDELKRPARPILQEGMGGPARSFFNIPLVIGTRVEGVLTVAHTKAGLYKEEDMTILYKIVQQASNAVTRLQEVVKTEQRKLNAMVESMTEGVVMTDKDYRIVVANPTIKRAIGLEDKKELSIFDFIDNLEGKFDIRGKLEESIKLDKVLVSRDILLGEHFWQIITAPVKSKLGPEKKEEVLGGVVIFHDITQEKEMERMREDFTSMMVHELRSPLTGIKKATEFMKRGEVREDEKAYNDYVQMIHDNASEILKLVNDLLDVAKIEAGKFEIHQEPTDIRQTIEERVRFFEHLAKDAKIRLQSSLDRNLPSKVNGDAARIVQVLNNLISNALKFTSAGGTVTVQALLHKHNQDARQEGKKLGFKWFLSKSKSNLKDLPDSVLLAVTDTGVGIPADALNQVFSKFKQIQDKRIKSETEGTGLGLSIVKGIVEAHNGIIGVESEEGEGSSFYFTIPM